MTMTEKADTPLLGQLREELAGLRDEVRESIELRRQLALLEIKADLRSARRLTIVVATAAVMALTALPLLLVSLAYGLDGCWGLSSGLWMLLFGAALAVAAPVTGLLAWRHFRRHFVGLRQTLDELREDALWMGEMIGKDQ
jgi:hypothetical protein